MLSFNEGEKGRGRKRPIEIAAAIWQRTISIIFDPADKSPRVIKVRT